MRDPYKRHGRYVLVEFLQRWSNMKESYGPGEFGRFHLETAHSLVSSGIAKYVIPKMCLIDPEISYCTDRKRYSENVEARQRRAELE